MKPIFLFLFLAISSASFSQRTLTGLWTGSLTHDSVVARKDLSFELALTQYKQKVYGYTRRTFIVRDTLYYVIKRVKGKIDGNVCEITDDEYISYNFQELVDKNVKVTYTFHFSETDSAWQLDGNWKTNKVRRNYRSMSGSISIEQEKNLDNSKLLAHLEELKLADDVAFYKESKNPVAPPPTAVADNKKPNKPKEKNTETAKNEQPKKTVTQPPPVTNKEEKTTDQSIAVVKNQEKQPESNASILKNEEKTLTPPPAKKEEKQAETATALTNKPEKTKPITTTELPAETVKNQAPPVVVEEKATPAEIKPTPPEIKLPIAAAKVAERKTLPPQVVEFKTDSLELSLYDNGEVDGDTVSVLLNGEVIMAKQGLKASAVKKMIYFPKGSDEFTLVLYAENLGKYPPNTGLLIIHDGEEVHQMRFSADLQQNAAVIFRRKK